MFSAITHPGCALSTPTTAVAWSESVGTSKAALGLGMSKRQSSDRDTDVAPPGSPGS